MPWMLAADFVLTSLAFSLPLILAALFVGLALGEGSGRAAERRRAIEAGAAEMVSHPDTEEAVFVYLDHEALTAEIAQLRKALESINQKEVYHGD